MSYEQTPNRASIAQITVKAASFGKSIIRYCKNMSKLQEK